MFRISMSKNGKMYLEVHTPHEPETVMDHTGVTSFIELGQADLDQLYAEVWPMFIEQGLQGLRGIDA